MLYPDDVKDIYVLPERAMGIASDSGSVSGKD